MRPQPDGGVPDLVFGTNCPDPERWSGHGVLLEHDRVRADARLCGGGGVLGHAPDIPDRFVRFGRTREVLARRR